MAQDRSGSAGGAGGAGALDELDLALIHALQVSPRAPWTELGPVLGADPVTLARRWRRLEASGSAWVTCYPAPGRGSFDVGCMALVEVDVEPALRLEVARATARDVHALTVHHMTGGRDLELTVAAPDPGTLTRYVLHRLSARPGVRATRVRLVTRLYQEGSAWRLRSLDPAQRRSLLGPGPRRGPAAPVRVSDAASARGSAATPVHGSAAAPIRVPDAAPVRVPDAAPVRVSDADQALVLALGRDGRLPVGELAEASGLSPATASRRLARLVASGQARLRCEVAHSLSGWPVCATLWLRVPPPELDETAWALAANADVRMCVAVTGEANLCVAVWLRSAGDVPALEADWLRRFPRITVLDRSVVLEVTKRMGRLLTPDGRAEGYVPLNIWADPLPDEQPRLGGNPND
ncbi:Lrp/AsnC family transcriptional regulator [Yinghuangia seranimata]|uniref:Lrp/AsnC family transcriptional regulator n=1 Tax=Yinghuangia seranimata TaxID=408067 RepID=UPI00248C8684|nr:Lrp/AsnC family transcriptional regulator [Yinghuangia seranimata]MDI2127652.1 Lrp/AsnC family transcriptional regulator [Yinghuangia seranimata]